MNIESFDFSTDLLPVILWQYDNAKNLVSLLKAKQSWYDINQTEFWENWTTNIFNLANTDVTDNATNLFRLAVWSIILDVPLFVPTGDITPTPIWGFNNTVPENAYVNFTHGVFSFSELIYLTLPQQQYILLLKYFNCITRGSIQQFIDAKIKPSAPDAYLHNFPISINNYFAYLQVILGDQIGYGGQTVYCYDNLNMTITYHFSGGLGSFPAPLFNAITQLDLWPRPAGVTVLFA